MASSKTIVTMICISLISLAAVGCSDDSPTNPVDRAPVYNAPPATPMNLSVEFDAVGTLATISWAPNEVDADLAGYLVIRNHYGNVTNLVSSPTMITSFEDTAPLRGISTYYVFSVDEAGQTSDVASCELIITAIHQTRELQR